MSIREEDRNLYDRGSFAEELNNATRRAPRVAPTGDAMESFAVRLPTSILNQARAQAREEGVSTGELLRRLIESGLDSHNDNLDAPH